MSHADAIDLIQSGGSKVRLLIRRTGQMPNLGSGMCFINILDIMSASCLCLNCVEK